MVGCRQFAGGCRLAEAYFDLFCGRRRVGDRGIDELCNLWIKNKGFNKYKIMRYMKFSFFNKDK